ncbi:MAG TPA: AbrB/MazE/SpoVT family DNA-binding domain-containing protein [Acetobacteraceae bacterium]|nr:AbrB/MazE/SpoVT family DNA-binding domain-containing protein [Acetobacteraceae bacterium]
MPASKGSVVLGTAVRREHRSAAQVKSFRSTARQSGFQYAAPMVASYGIIIDREDEMAAKDTARLSTKFQISIPKSIRTAQRWQAGQVFAFIPKGEGMLLVPVPKLEELAAIARGATSEEYRDRPSRV